MQVSVEEDLAPANLGNLSHLPLSVKRDLISHLYQHASTSCGGNGEDSVFAKGIAALASGSTVDEDQTAIDTAGLEFTQAARKWLRGGLRNTRNC